MARSISSGGLGVWHKCAQIRLTCHSDAYQTGGREKSRASLLAYDLRNFGFCSEAGHNFKEGISYGTQKKSTRNLFSGDRPRVDTARIVRRKRLCSINVR
jgi:hypothetical protein